MTTHDSPLIHEGVSIVFIYSFAAGLVNQEMGPQTLRSYYQRLRNALVAAGFTKLGRGVYTHSEMTHTQALNLLGPFYRESWVRRFAYRFAIYEVRQLWSISDVPPVRL